MGDILPEGYGGIDEGFGGGAPRKPTHGIKPDGNGIKPDGDG